MKVPIVPVVLHNVSDALPKGRLLVRPATVQVTVMAPVWPEEIRSLKQAGEALRERYRAVMRAPFMPAGADGRFGSARFGHALTVVPAEHAGDGDFDEELVLRPRQEPSGQR